MSGERVGGSSQETRGAIEACCDGASNGVLGCQNRAGGAEGNPEAATSPSLDERKIMRGVTLDCV